MPSTLHSNKTQIIHLNRLTFASQELNIVVQNAIAVVCGTASFSVMHLTIWVTRCFCIFDRCKETDFLPDNVTSFLYLWQWIEAACYVIGKLLFWGGLSWIFFFLRYSMVLQDAIHRNEKKYVSYLLGSRKHLLDEKKRFFRSTYFSNHVTVSGSFLHSPPCPVVMITTSLSYIF